MTVTLYPVMKQTGAKVLAKVLLCNFIHLPMSGGILENAILLVDTSVVSIHHQVETEALSCLDVYHSYSGNT